MKRISLLAEGSYYIALPILIILCIVAYYFRTQQIKNKKISFRCKDNKSERSMTVVTGTIVMLGIYITGYVWITLLYRKPAGKASINLIPLSSYRMAFQLFPFRIRRAWRAREIIFNILLTVPLGLLLPILLHTKRHS